MCNKTRGNFSNANHMLALGGIFLICLVLLHGDVWAFELYKDDKIVLNADLTIEAGIFYSQESYAQLRSESGSQTWQEGTAEYGFSGSYMVGSKSRVYGAVSLLSSATSGDGDAAGFTTGSEGHTDFEKAYLGWRSGDLISGLGENGFDISGGKQTYVIGDGFLVNGDAENFGKGFDKLAKAGIAPESLDRGGAYYMAARNTFFNTVILRLGGAKGLHGEAFWLKSDNEGQAKTELAGASAEYVSDQYGTIGLTYIKGLSVDDELAEFLGLTHRDGQDTFSIRYAGSAGVENLSLSGEYVYQDNGDDGDDYAWYAEAGWTFAEVAWKPNLGVRYSTFSTGFDPLFYGDFRGLGTWFQGEVAGNYAGPFNTNADITHLYLKAQPLSSVSVGVLYFNFQTRNKSLGNLDANEVDIYAEWTINDHVTISPLVGFYDPEKSAEEGGIQLGSSDTSLYAQATMVVSF